MAKTNDLGKDPILKLVLRLAIPAMLGQFVNVLYSVVDRIYISRMGGGIGDIALAGVGVCGPVITLITSFTYLAALGGSALVAMRLGENNKESAERILSNCAMLLIVISVLLTGLFLALKNGMLYWFGASAKSFPFADTYFTIYTLGSIFALGSLGLNFFITSQGFSGMSMITVLIGAVLNIALDPLFIFVFHMGVGGAALATVISQAASCAWAVLFLLGKRTQVKLKFARRAFSWKIMKRVMLMGLSPFLIVATDSVILIVLNAVLKAYSGGGGADLLITAATIVLSYMQLITMPLGGITSGTQPILGYNFGANNPDRIKKSVFWTLTISLVFTSVMFTVSQVCPQFFVSIFTSDPAIAETAVKGVKIFTLGIIPLTFQYAFVDGLTALGISRVAVTLSLTRKIGILMTLTLVLPAIFGATAAFWAEPIADIAAGILSTFVFCFSINKILKKRAALPTGQALYS